MSELLIKSDFLEQKTVKQYIESLAEEFDSFESLNKHLIEYKWPDNSKGIGFEETYSKFKDNRKKMNNALVERDPIVIAATCSSILLWGGVGVAQSNIKVINQLRKEGKLVDTLLDAKKTIENEIIDINSINFRVNSGFSKIYASLSERFIIYDSRVAAKMCSIVSRTFNGENPFDLGKAAYKAKSNRDPGSQYKMISGNNKKYFLSNIKASWIIEKLSEENSFTKFSKSKLMFAYQTALFQMGYNI